MAQGEGGGTQVLVPNGSLSSGRSQTQHRRGQVQAWEAGLRVRASQKGVQGCTLQFCEEAESGEVTQAHGIKPLDGTLRSTEVTDGTKVEKKRSWIFASECSHWLRGREWIGRVRTIGGDTVGRKE